MSRKVIGSNAGAVLGFFLAKSTSKVKLSDLAEYLYIIKIVYSDGCLLCIGGQ